MRAITEIPANTPRPIGRTDNFFPGRVNAPSEEALAAAAEADDAAAEDAAAESAADVPTVGREVLELFGVLDVATVEGGGGEDAKDAVAAGTVDTPLTFTAGFVFADPLEVVAELVVVVVPLSVPLGEELV